MSNTKLVEYGKYRDFNETDFSNKIIIRNTKYNGKNSIKDFIKESLKNNQPVATLQYFKPNENVTELHWYTITKYFKGLNLKEYLAT